MGEGRKKGKVKTERERKRERGIGKRENWEVGGEEDSKEERVGVLVKDGGIQCECATFMQSQVPTLMTRGSLRVTRYRKRESQK